MGVFDIFNLLDKENLISHEDYIERLKICNPCHYRIKTDLGLVVFNNCGLCGCFMIEKAQLKESKGGNCPDNRWKKLNN